MKIVDKKQKSDIKKKGPRKIRKDKGTRRGKKKGMPKWTPTVPQKKLLVTLMQPENRHLNIQDLCKKAGVSRTVYYKGFDNPYFADEYKRLSLTLITQAVGPILQSAIREAKMGSFNHTKLLLEMENLHQDSLALTGKSGGPIITSDMPAKQAAEIYAEIIKGGK